MAPLATGVFQDVVRCPCRKVLSLTRSRASGFDPDSRHRVSSRGPRELPPHLMRDIGLEPSPAHRSLVIFQIC